MRTSTKRVKREIGTKVAAHRSDADSPREKVSTPVGEPGLLTKLLRIKIDGPEDFSANLDQYLSGERQIQEGRGRK